MKKLTKHCYVVALLAALSFTDRAEASFTICNESDDSLFVALLDLRDTDFALLIGSYFHMDAWYEYLPGKCDYLFRWRGPHRAYLSFRDPDGNIVLSSDRADSGSHKHVEKFFCVKGNGQAFSRKRLRTLEAHQDCPQGYVLQLFNHFFHIPDNTNFTYTIR